MDDGRSLTGRGRKILLASPEKAILDFFYIHIHYKTEKDMEHLRLDEALLKETLNWKFFSYLEKYTNNSLEDRIKKMRKAYAL